MLAGRASGLAVVDVTIPNDLGAGVDVNQGGGRWHHAFHHTSLAEEPVVEPAECLRFFAADVTEAVVIDCGHFVPEEAPDELARHLRAFLARLEG